MSCTFRYLNEREESAVTLELFRRDGKAFGEVTGPRRFGLAIDSSAKVRPTTPSEAFAAAIRMANSDDLEVVVVGDSSVWEPSWGRLASDGVAPAWKHGATTSEERLTRA